MSATFRGTVDAGPILGSWKQFVAIALPLSHGPISCTIAMVVSEVEQCRERLRPVRLFVNLGAHFTSRTQAVVTMTGDILESFHVG